MVVILPQTIGKRLSEDEFLEICHQNPDSRVELKANGEVIIMPPTYSETGEKNNELLFQVTLWNKQIGKGKVFDSSTGFTLPNGAVRSPDVSWISKARWEALSTEEKKGFAKVCPDFVIELKSDSDNLKELQEKMKEWIENGTLLAWLIDSKSEQVSIYRPNQAEESINSFEKPISGETILEGFEMDLKTLRML